MCIIQQSAGLLNNARPDPADFRRLFKDHAKLHGIDIIELNFSVASDYLLKQAVYQKNRNRCDKLFDPMEGLTYLDNRATKYIACHDTQGHLIEDSDQKKGQPDCDNNLFYRTGLSGKTAHGYDKPTFNTMMDLGRLLARLKAEEIHSLLYK